MDRQEDKGRYKSIPVRILNTNAEVSPPYLIKSKMEELIKWYNNSNFEQI
ncbi:MAG: hypothetical protein ACK5HP_04595 [Bacilli bacterium]